MSGLTLDLAAGDKAHMASGYLRLVEHEPATGSGGDDLLERVTKPPAAMLPTERLDSLPLRIAA